MLVNQELQGKENDNDKEDNSLIQELWIVKDDKQNKQWIFTWITLYDVKISKNASKRLLRTLPFSYESLWKYFGVDIESCDRSDILMFASMLLDTMELEMPTINLQRDANEDSDAEEEVHIKLKNISTVCHARHIIDIEDWKVPLTISLIGNDEKYFGIKAVVFNRSKMKEEGVFLRVDTDEWRYDEDTIKKLPAARKKDKLKNFYSLPKILENTGFEYIYKKLKFDQEKVPFIENVFGDVTNIDVFPKSALRYFEE